MDATTPKVYAAIVAVMADLAHDGIGKNRKNQAQGFNFRGVDDVYNALAPALSKHRLAILPRVLSRSCEERQTAKGGTLFYVVCDVEFTLVSAEDGSSHVVRFVGEAMDSADKATNKAMSAAYKYAAFQTFCIPTEGDNDADAHAPEPVAPKSREKKQHDANFNDTERRRFNAKIGDLGIKYDDLADYLVSEMGRARPSEMTQESRDKLLSWLDTPTNADKVRSYAVAVGSVPANK